MSDIRIMFSIIWPLVLFIAGIAAFRARVVADMEALEKRLAEHISSDAKWQSELITRLKDDESGYVPDGMCILRAGKLQVTLEGKIAEAINNLKDAIFPEIRSMRREIVEELKRGNGGNGGGK